MPELEPATLKLLTGSLPDFGTYGNPLDITTAYAPDNLPAITKALLDDANVGMLLFSAASGVQVNKLNEGMARLEQTHRPDDARRQLAAAAADCGSGGGEPGRALALHRSDVADRRQPGRYGRSLARTPLRDAPAPFKKMPELGEGAQPEWFGKKILAAAAIRVPDGDLARTVDEALAVAARVGYPVVLKAQAAALAHKTEAGGVALNITDEAALRGAWSAMMRSVKRAAPDVVLDGILVGGCSPKGIELMVGAKRDKDWGSVLLVGLGGIWVEALGDVQILPDDADETEIVEAVRRLRSAKLLDGVRGALPADIDAVALTVLAIGRLMRTVPRDRRDRRQPVDGAREGARRNGARRADRHARRVTPPSTSAAISSLL